MVHDQLRVIEDRDLPEAHEENEEGEKRDQELDVNGAALVSRELVEPVLEHVGLGGLAMPISMVGAVGSNVISGFRNAGIAKTADLLKEAMLDPEIAKTALMRASQRANEGSERTLVTQLRRLAVLGPQTYSDKNQADYRRAYAGR